MFGRPPDWSDYRQDILLFCEMLHDPQWVPTSEAREFLLAVQRGYHRVGLSGARDAWMAVGAACLWRACCFPDQIQFIMAGTTKSGYAWIRFLKSIASTSSDVVRQHLLFTKDDCSVLVRHADSPAITVLSPGHLVGMATIINSRPTTLVMPDVDRVPTKWLPGLKRLVATEKDQWLVVAPAGR